MELARSITTFTALPRASREDRFRRYFLLGGVDFDRGQFSSPDRQLPSHSQAGRIVTTDEVLNEYLAFFSGARPSVRRAAGDTVADLLVRAGVSVIPQSRESFLAGLELYRARSDKSYSLTDCISMETMRRQGVRQVLTNDRHFEQEGLESSTRSGVDVGWKHASNALQTTSSASSSPRRLPDGHPSASCAGLFEPHRFR